MRTTRGVAGGIGLLVVAFEFEYATTAEDLAKSRPSLTTGMGNVLVQTPFSSLQFYGTVGAGAYRERLGSVQETNVGTNVGGGVKFKLLGPIRGRLDYREYGGAPLLGVEGVVIIAHGRSDARAIVNAVRAARDAAAGDVVGAIKASQAVQA